MQNSGCETASARNAARPSDEGLKERCLYVLVIPLGGIIFSSAGRHPLAGIACAFAGVSGGFSANFIPSGIDPLLQGFTQSAAQLLDPDAQVSIVNNNIFTAVSTLLIALVGVSVRR